MFAYTQTLFTIAECRPFFNTKLSLSDLFEYYLPDNHYNDVYSIHHIIGGLYMSELKRTQMYLPEDVLRKLKKSKRE